MSHGRPYKCTRIRPSGKNISRARSSALSPCLTQAGSLCPPGSKLTHLDERHRLTPPATFRYTRTARPQSCPPAAEDAAYKALALTVLFHCQSARDLTCHNRLPLLNGSSYPLRSHPALSLVQRSAMLTRECTPGKNAAWLPITAQRRIWVGRRGDGVAAISLMDGSGRPRIVMSAPASGTPTLEFFDESGNVVQRLVPEPK